MGIYLSVCGGGGGEGEGGTERGGGGGGEGVAPLFQPARFAAN